MIKIIPVFRYFDSIISHMLAQQPFPLSEIHMVAGRKSGKTYNTMLAMIKMALLIPNTTMYMMRQAKSDVRSLYDQLLAILHAYDKNLSGQTRYRTVLFPNHSQIICLGLKSQNSSKISLQGIGGVSGRYTVIFLEERHEFQTKDIDAITQAVRGFNHALFINACNPWSKKHKYINWCSEQVPFDAAQLKVRGYIYQRKKTDLFHYGNYLANPNLSEEDEKSLLKTINPVHKPVVLWGIPGIQSGGIYQSHLGFIKTRLDRVATRFRFGVDFGEINDATTCHFAAYDGTQTGIAFLDEYFGQNNPQRINKDSLSMAREVVDFILSCLLRGPMSQHGSVRIYVDKSASSFKSEIKQYLRESGHNLSLVVLTASVPKIKYRVDTFLKLMASKNFYVVKAPNLLRELDFSEGVETNTLSRGDNPKRNDKDDHAINSAEYCMTSDLSRWGRKNGNNGL